MARFSTRSATAALALGLLFAAAACGGDENEGNGGDDTTADDGMGGGELTLYQALSPEGMEPVIEAFEAYYLELTGNEVTVSDFNQSGGDLRATLDLEARGDAVQADVVRLDLAEVVDLDEAYPDLFADDYDPESLEDDAVLQAARDQSAESPGTMVSLQPYVMVYNSDLVTGDDIPSSWLDLLDDRWTNQIGLGDPEATSGAHVPLWFLTDYLAGEIGSPFGWEYYERLGELNPRLESSHSAIMEYVAAGELQVGVLGFGTALTSALDGNPVVPVLPEEGTSGLVGTVSLIADSPERALGEVFIDWLVSQEGQQVTYEGSGTVPIRDDVELDEMPFEFDVTSDKIVPLDAKWVADNREANVDMFRESMG